MTPNMIAIKMQALKQDLVLAGAAVDEGNFLRAQSFSKIFNAAMPGCFAYWTCN